MKEWFGRGVVWLRNGNFMTGLVVERVSERELEEGWT
jgi:hypothetical protein